MEIDTESREQHKRHILGYLDTRFFIGLIVGAFFSKVIPMDALPYWVTDVIDSNPSANGWYYYVTETNSNKLQLQLPCNNSGKTLRIGGVVSINHTKQSSGDSEISFRNGEREYCLSGRGVFEELSPHAIWESEWAVIKERKIYALFKLPDNLKSLLNAEISKNGLFQDKFSFRGPLLYITDPLTKAAHLCHNYIHEMFIERDL